MIHIMDGDWEILDHPTIIDCKEVYYWIEKNHIEPELVSIPDIGYKTLSTIRQDSLRYVNANMALPCIVVKGMTNPEGKPYRMIDGRHRLLKCLTYCKSSILCYVIDNKDAIKFIRDEYY